MRIILLFNIFLLSTNPIFASEMSNIDIQDSSYSAISKKPVLQTTSILEDLRISKMGFGAFQLSYPEMSIDAATKLLARAIESGCTFFDTAAAYGMSRHSERLLGSILGSANVFLSTKCGIDFVTDKYTQSPQEIIQSVELSLSNLLRNQLDLVYLHRINPSATSDEFEETISTLKSLVVNGKAKYIGLSEPTNEQLLKAIEIEPRSIPISAVQSAYSIFTRRAEVNGVLGTCQENGILFVSFKSALQGLADMRLKQIEEWEVDNLPLRGLKDKVFGLLNFDPMRQSLGWFEDDYMRDNIRLAKKFIDQADRLGITPAQLSLAWTISKGVVPIPGTTKEGHLDENMAALKVSLSEAAMIDLEELFPYGAVKGTPNPTIYSTFDNDNTLEKRL